MVEDSDDVKLRAFRNLLLVEGLVVGLIIVFVVIKVLFL